MIHSVNLIPLACLRRQARVRRRNVWGLVFSGAVVLVLGLWLIRAHHGGATGRLRGELSEAQARLLALTGHLESSRAERNVLLERLHQLSALRCPQPWAERLATLTRQAPPQVVLSELSARVGPLRSPTPSARVPSSPAAAGEALEGKDDGVVPSAVSVAGFAVDHGALIRLIETMHDIEGFGEAELVRAIRKPYRNGFAIAFELQSDRREAVR